MEANAPVSILNEFASKEFDVSVITLLVTVLMFIFGMIIILRKTFNQSGKVMCLPEIFDDRLASIVINQEEGIRQLNPNHRILIPGQKDTTHFKFHDPFCKTIINILEQEPNRELFGYHHAPDDPYKWITAGEFLIKVKSFASGLYRKLDIEAGSNTKVGIYAINCIEWMIAHYALYAYSNIAVPLYSTLGNDAIEYIMEFCKLSSCIVLNDIKALELLDLIARSKSEKNPKMFDNLKSIIVMRISSTEGLNLLKKKSMNIKIFTMDEIIHTGHDKLIPFMYPDDDHHFLINFTSGTTGKPKGVLVAGTMMKRVVHSMILTPTITRFAQYGDVYFSFLPLAHVLEQVILTSLIHNRGRIGFYSGDITKLMLEMQMLKPTIITLVPRLLVRIHEEFMKKLKRFYIPDFLINFMIQNKLNYLAKNGRHNNNTIFDMIVFKKLRMAFGGCVEVLVTGSSSCPTEVLSFIRAGLNSHIYVGYGLTETAGPFCSTFPDDIDPRHTGVPLEGVQVKLGDVPEMNLFPSKNKGVGRGEILVKSLTCTKGYFEDPIKTKELFDPEGWLCTGDIGEWDKWGHLIIVDRCKNIFKLSQGEYVTPEKVESSYIACPYVEQVFVDGRSDQSYAIAIVYPNVAALEKKFRFTMIKEEESSYRPNLLTMQQICESKEFKEYILKEMNERARKDKLEGFKLAKKIHLIMEPMSIENSMLTSTLKPIRGNVRKIYKSSIERMYSTSF